MLRRNIFQALVFGFVLAITGCGDDGGSGGVDVGAECNRELCAGSEELRNVCIDEYNDCVRGGGDPGQCIALAVETCTV